MNADQSQGSGAVVECRDRLAVEEQGAQLDLATAGAGGGAKRDDECGTVEGQGDDEIAGSKDCPVAPRSNDRDPPGDEVQRSLARQEQADDVGAERRGDETPGSAHVARQHAPSAPSHEHRGDSAHLCSWSSSHDQSADVTVWHITCCAGPSEPHHSAAAASPPPAPSLPRESAEPLQSSTGEESAQVRRARSDSRGWILHVHLGG
ncbi:unnamed protein product [Closterium sp. Yama58-4]|nr:unnamed protein product [Closterium sp. Yama58-4]